MRTDLIKQRQQWYNNAVVLFQIYESVKDREVILMNRVENWKCSRCFKIRNITEARWLLLQVRKIYLNDINIYMSLARYKNIPDFTFNLVERSNFTREWFKNQAKKEVYSFDLFLDFDYKEKEENDKYKEYLEELTNFVVMLKKENICFRLMFSGSGYQIIIPSQIWGFDGNFYNALNLVNAFIEVFKLKYIDNKGIQSFNKIIKCPYSLVYNKVVLPINFLPLSREFYKIDNIYKNIIIRNRGLLWFNLNKSNTDFNNFIKKYGICKVYNRLVLEYEKKQLENREIYLNLEKNLNLNLEEDLDLENNLKEVL